MTPAGSPPCRGQREATGKGAGAETPSTLPPPCTGTCSPEKPCWSRRGLGRGHLRGLSPRWPVSARGGEKAEGTLLKVEPMDAGPSGNEDSTVRPWAASPPQALVPTRTGLQDDEPGLGLRQRDTASLETKREFQGNPKTVEERKTKTSEETGALTPTATAKVKHSSGSSPDKNKTQHSRPVSLSSYWPIHTPGFTKNNKTYKRL